MKLIPYEWMHRLRFARWERRPVIGTGLRVDGPGVLPPGRVLDAAAGRGRDACYLARRGWQVTGVDLIGAAIAWARRRDLGSAYALAGWWRAWSTPAGQGGHS